MNEYFSIQGRQRALLFFLAVAFAGMAAVSLWQRMMHPELVVSSRSRQPVAGRDEAPQDRMGEIGKLMQQVKNNPGDVAAMIHLAEHLADTNPEAAENFLRKAVVAAPGDPQPLYLLGEVLHKRGEHAEAATCLERVLSLRDEPSVRYSLGVLYLRYLKQPERGIRHLRAALAQPKLPDDLAAAVRAELDAFVTGAESAKDAVVPTKAPKTKKPSGGPEGR